MCILQITHAKICIKTEYNVDMCVSILLRNMCIPVQFTHLSAYFKGYHQIFTHLELSSNYTLKNAF